MAVWVVGSRRPRIPGRGTVPAMATLVIRGAAQGDDPARGVCDILVRDGRIAERGPDLVVDQALDEEHEEIDGTGLVALPGAIDAHARIADPRTPQAPADDLGSGTIAAARGGVTTILAPVVAAAPDTPPMAFDGALVRGQGNVFVDWGLYAGVGRPDPGSADMLRGLAARDGFAGAYLDLDAVDEAATAGPGAILRIAGLADVPITVRAAGLLGADAERRRIGVLSDLGALADVRPHVLPVATARGLEALDGIATASTSLAHLCLDALPEGAAVRPPLGDAGDREALWQALAAGVLEGVVSDHRSEPLNGAAGWVGVSSVELLVPALLTHGVAAGRIDLPTLCEVIAGRPARRLGIHPRKGSLEVGADGDILLVDLERTWVVAPEGLEGRGKAPAWHGRELTGAVVHVVSRGQRIVADGAPLFRPGRGRPAFAGRGA